MEKDDKIVIAGAAGLVGQNLIIRLTQQGFTNILGIDKHSANCRTLKRLNLDVEVIEADLSQEGWEDNLAGAACLILSQAQINSLNYDDFVANNVTATKNLLATAEAARVSYVVHISSMVVESGADDYYTRSKDDQENLVVGSALNHCVLRPTLMFGWFDRKHFAWLARLMQRIPVFPVPGSGRYMRQPLYVVDFCDVIIACILQQPDRQSYNITGLEKIDYIDMMRMIRTIIGCRTPIVRIPYRLFWLLLKIYAMFDRTPPFTTPQLEALVAGDDFEVFDWPTAFNIEATPLREALHSTFTDPNYSGIVLKRR